MSEADTRQAELETVFIIGATGNIGVSAILGALKSGLKVLAAVRNQNSVEKMVKNVEYAGGDTSRIVTVETDVLSEHGVQDVVDRVRKGELPAFQHVYAAVGGIYTEQSMLDTSLDQLREVMRINFEPNFLAYRATIPYLLEQKDRTTTFTICTGGSGDAGNRALPAMTQGALFSMCYSACNALRDTNVRFNEMYLAYRVDFDAVAEQDGTMKSSRFGRVYEQILAKPDLRSCRIRVAGDKDIENLRIEEEPVVSLG